MTTRDPWRGLSISGQLWISPSLEIWGNRPRPRDQQMVLSNDGRRHHSRERARSRLDLHDPAATYCRGSKGSCAGPHRRGDAESSLSLLHLLRSPFGT